MYSSFDSHITIRSKIGKTFDEKTLKLNELKQIEGISMISKAIEEIVVLRHEKKWVNARILGVENSFLSMISIHDMKNNQYTHLVDGSPNIEYDGKSYGLIGANLLQKLNGYIPFNSGHELITCYAPRRDAKISVSSNPFSIQQIQIAGRINYNKEVNDEALIIPIKLAKSILDYESDISALYINTKNKEKIAEIKEKILSIIPSTFEVKTHLEKNELIYKTSKSEKLIVISILVFIFILAAVNLVASLTMLFIEKKKNILTLETLGADKQFIFKIFFYEGLLISFKGIFIGFISGILICLLQLKFKLLLLPGANGEAFPISFDLNDGILVVFLVSSLSILASYFPVKFLVYKNKINRIDATID